MVDKKAFVQDIYNQALAAGLSDAAARVTAAQAAIESSYGSDAPGNNLFGIIAGPDWTGATIQRNDNGNLRQFRSYASPSAGMADRIAVMSSKFPGFSNATTIDDALTALQNGVRGKYYEAPQAQYESAVKGINSKYMAELPPRPPANIPAPVAALPTSPQDYLGTLQYGHPAGGVGVNASNLDPEFARRMAALVQAAEGATGDKVQIFEGYRDPKRQAQLRANFLGTTINYDGTSYSPQAGVKGYKAGPPGKSEHQLGMAVDIRAGSEPDKYPSGPAFDWMVKHAAEYGVHWLGSSDPAHFEIPETEYKVAAAGGRLKPFGVPDSYPAPGGPIAAQMRNGGGNAKCRLGSRGGRWWTTGPPARAASPAQSDLARHPAAAEPCRSTRSCRRCLSATRCSAIPPASMLAATCRLPLAEWESRAIRPTSPARPTRRCTLLGWAPAPSTTRALRRYSSRRSTALR